MKLIVLMSSVENHSQTLKLSQHECVLLRQDNTVLINKFQSECFMSEKMLVVSK